jgi:hypothetical protein
MSLILGAANMPRLADRYLAHARRHLPGVEQRPSTKPSALGLAAKLWGQSIKSVA